MKLIPCDFIEIAMQWPDEAGAKIFEYDRKKPLWYMLYDELLPVGFCCLSDRCLDYYYIDKKFRRKGYGTHMCELILRLNIKYVFAPNPITCHILEDKLNYRLEVLDYAHKLYIIQEELLE